MAGLLTHLGAGLLGSLIIWFAFYKEERIVKLFYGLGFFIGNLAPDLIDFGILGLWMGSLSPREIMTHSLFHAFAVFGHTYMNWLIGAVIFLVIVGVLFLFKKVSKLNFYRCVIGSVLFLIGVAIHLRLDKLIMETSYWI